MIFRLSLSAIILSANLAFIQNCTDKEEPFVCNDNTVSTVNGEEECGTSQVMAYENTASRDYFQMHVAGGYTVTLQTDGELLEEGETYSVPVGFSNLNRTFENTITLVKLDRANKILTFKYNFYNEAESNFQAYELKAKGKVTEINWY